MSYSSESELLEGTKLIQVREIVALLGYKKIRDGLKVPRRTDGFMWYDEEDYRSYVGVELDIYHAVNGQITVTTRSRVGRSYWDLIHQNRTLKLLRDIFGGHFTTDAGQNRYWRPDTKPPSPMSSGCFIARWHFHNAMGRAKVYLMNRKLEGPIARDAPSGLGFVDEMNPRILANNLVLPYVVAIWEDYFRSTFTAVLHYSNQRDAALKRARLSPAHLEQVAVGAQSVERVVAESFSFQRPSTIAENFRLLDPKLDLGAALRKPYKRRKISLFDSIEALIEDRNEFVHTGNMKTSLFDAQLKKCLTDIEAAVDRCYVYVGKHYSFTPSHNY